MTSYFEAKYRKGKQFADEKKKFQMKSATFTLLYGEIQNTNVYQNLGTECTKLVNMT